MFNLGMGEITVILLLALIFIGPKKLPDLATQLGKLIREVRKATSDVKNEISLDDSFRKPFEELRDAVTLHPEELKRRDEWRRTQEEAAKRAAEEAAKYNAELAAGGGTEKAPDGLESPVKIVGASAPDLAALAAKVAQPGPNDTVVQAAPPHSHDGATLDDIPTPPPEAKPQTIPTAGKPAPSKPLFGPPTAMKPPGSAPSGSVARPETLRGVKPVAPVVADSGNPNVTQILKEEDLIPSFSSGKPPPPPHLPGLRPASTPPLPPPSTDINDKKKS